VYRHWSDGPEGENAYDEVYQYCFKGAPYPGPDGDEKTHRKFGSFEEAAQWLRRGGVMPETGGFVDGGPTALCKVQRLICEAEKEAEERMERQHRLQIAVLDCVMAGHEVPQRFSGRDWELKPQLWEPDREVDPRFPPELMGQDEPLVNSALEVRREDLTAEVRDLLEKSNWYGCVNDLVESYQVGDLAGYGKDFDWVENVVAEALAHLEAAYLKMRRRKRAMRKIVDMIRDPPRRKAGLRSGKAMVEQAYREFKCESAPVAEGVAAGAASAPGGAGAPMAQAVGSAPSARSDRELELEEQLRAVQEKLQRYEDRGGGRAQARPVREATGETVRHAAGAAAEKVRALATEGAGKSQGVGGGSPEGVMGRLDQLSEAVRLLAARVAVQDSGGGGAHAGREERDWGGNRGWSAVRTRHGR
jgi:hypothetical protein